MEELTATRHDLQHLIVAGRSNGVAALYASPAPPPGGASWFCPAGGGQWHPQPLPHAPRRRRRRLGHGDEWNPDAARRRFERDRLVARVRILWRPWVLNHSIVVAFMCIFSTIFRTADAV